MEPPKDVIAIAQIQPKPAHYDACKAALLELQKTTLQESGCLRFDIYEREGSCKELYLFEHFASAEKRDLHLSYDYTKKVIELYKDWLAEGVVVIKLKSAV